MNFAVTFFAMAAAGMAVPAAAQTPAAAVQEEPKQAQEDDKICRLVALNPDSRRKERLCLTPTEWRKLNNPR